MKYIQYPGLGIQLNIYEWNEHKQKLNSREHKQVRGPGLFDSLSYKESTFVLKCQNLVELVGITSSIKH